MTTTRWSQIRPGEQPFVNVKAYPFNAKGDGITDDTAAFVAAQAAAAAVKGTVFVPPGTFKLAPDSLVIGTEVRLIGSGRFDSILIPTGNGTTFVEVNSGIALVGAEVRDIGFDLTAFPGITNALKISNVFRGRFDNLAFTKGTNGLVLGDNVNWTEFSNMLMWDQTNHAVRNTTNTSTDNSFTDFQIQVNTGFTQQAGWYHSRTTAIDNGLTTLRNIRIVNVGGTRVDGIVLTSSVPTTTFNYFMEGITSDNINGSGSPLRLVNAGGIYVGGASWLGATGASNAAISINAGAGFNFVGNDIFSTNGDAIAIDGFPTYLRFTSNVMGSPTYAFKFNNVSSGWAFASVYGNTLVSTVLTNIPGRMANGADPNNYFSAMHVMTNNSGTPGQEFTLDDSNAGTSRGIRNNGNVIEFRNAAGTQNAQRLKDNGGLNLLLGGVPIYANNAAALGGGLAAGDLYRSGSDPDIISIVH